MSPPNHAGGIIDSLASLPDFLRRPILERRVAEFFSMGEEDKAAVVADALEAGPRIPFHRFLRLFGTWLEVSAGLPEARRAELFGRYVRQVGADPGILARFNMDGLYGALASLDGERRGIVAGTAARALSGLEPEQRRRLLLMMPDRARAAMGL